MWRGEGEEQTGGKENWSCVCVILSCLLTVSTADQGADRSCGGGGGADRWKGKLQLCMCEPQLSFHCEDS
jgi:hypothetical protein